MRAACIAAACALWSSHALADTLFDPLFQDHAVLQRDRPVHVWGKAPPRSQVTVSIAGQSTSTTASGTGVWDIQLPALAAGGPYELIARASGGSSTTLHDVLIGDVWLCSGQSNMEMPVRMVSNAGTEMDASANDRIRLMTVPRASSATPVKSVADGVVWRAASPDTVRDFAATCYFFGRDLHKANGVPQGLIHSSWGGSIIQSWISAPTLRQLGGYDEALRLLALHERQPQEAAEVWRTSMDRWWREHDPVVATWSASQFDDSGWSQIRPDTFWEQAGIPELARFDGILWYRTRITLTEEQARGAAVLSLGPVDDLDSTWVNGTPVGSLEGWNTPRDYRIPRGVLQPGVNVIAVGALDAGGGGGMWGSPAVRELKLQSGETIPLPAQWHYRIAGPVSQVGAPPHAPWQESVGTTTLYNAMIAPLAGYTLRGVAWYQGESNAAEPQEYARLLPALFKDWRRAFGSELPFLVVQLAGFGPAANAPSPVSWADIREVQRRAVSADGNAALASAIDIGDRYDIHPANKQQVGRRLALAARQHIFREPIAGWGPEPVTARRESNRVTVTFRQAPGGLVVVGGRRPAGFELCNARRECRFVDAFATGERVTLDAADVEDAAFVRYAWADSPLCNLYNDNDLPAVPFEIPIDPR